VAARTTPDPASGDGRGEGEAGEGGGVEMADDRRVDQDEEALGDERAEGRYREGEHPAVDRGRRVSIR